MKHQNTPALVTQEREFGNDFSESECTKIPTIQPPFNRQAVLDDIARNWVDMRCYPTFEAALIALVRGDEHE